jgi:hypothetical protein
MPGSTCLDMHYGDEAEAGYGRTGFVQQRVLQRPV